ncbi:DNA invertase Pin-like site-specific DNA recombinase [Nocardiopsis mwathae]|uniref:DNA invertase Pin-like site-specific DNA recombinase n=1 Tax=Nocardiopsis mwathae TaxID=1472723 RepID=A0A7X0D4N2_9ACTN|nr:ECF-type sigma factor [Nocardiopsis mwathae]MBB6171482.1 DNA invertase Pin-like site-specific DNA recombinase [Nocardiopsis mwathae]
MEDERFTRLMQSAREDESPLTALNATVQLRAEVERLQAVHVRRARLQGATWSEIATILGISKQAVHKKYGGSRREK